MSENPQTVSGDGAETAPEAAAVQPPESAPVSNAAHRPDPATQDIVFPDGTRCTLADLDPDTGWPRKSESD
ncbi:MAG TPA: hypothetical protein VIY48_02475 [Candidatus Paceibacterota bacterium]|jgi:hypothetical protein